MAQPPLTQYQPWAAPLEEPPPPVYVLLDAWCRQPDRPPRRPPFPSGLYASPVFPPTAALAVTEDMWDGRWTLPQWKRYPTREGLYATPNPVVLAASAVTEDMWDGRWTLPQWKRYPTREGLYTAPNPIVLAELTVTEDMWDGRWTLPQWKRYPTREGLYAAPNPATGPGMAVTLDEWDGRWTLPQWSRYARSTRLGVYVAPTSATGPGMATDWQSRWTTPAWKVAPRLPGGMAAPDPAALGAGAVTLDEWDGRWTLPRWGHRPRPPGGGVEPNTAALAKSGVSVDEWGAVWTTPAWKAPRRFEGGASPSSWVGAEPEPVYVSMWDGRWTTPRWGKAPRPPGGTTEPPISALGASSTLVSQWGIQSAEQVRVRPRRPPGGGAELPPEAALAAQVPSVAAWTVVLPPPKLPIYPQPPFAFAPIIPDAPNWSWFVTTETSARRRPQVPPEAFRGQVEPSLVVTPNTAWYVAPPLPRRLRSRSPYPASFFVPTVASPPPVTVVTTGTPFTRRLPARSMSRAAPSVTFARRLPARLFRRLSMYSAAFPVEWWVKGVSESRPYLFSLANFQEILAGQTIASATVTAVPTGLTIGTPVATASDEDGVPSGQAVRVRISGGTDGTDYVVTCLATTSSGNVLEVRGWLTVSDAHAPGPSTGLRRLFMGRLFLDHLFNPRLWEGR